MQAKTVNQDQYTGDDLGVSYHKTHSAFRIWAPQAQKMELVLYPTGNDSQGEIYPLEKDVQGTWTMTIQGDLHGTYYNYLVTYDQTTKEAMDPYAIACGVNGQRGMVVDLSKTNPRGWDTLQTPALAHPADTIIYELHIRDFTIDPNSGVKHRGKYLGLVESGTRSPDNLATGLDHLRQLGITHVQLMPCFDFYTIDETQLLPKEYNWGYDPQNYNSPEGSYASDPYHGAVRINELKQMIKTLKDNGFRVILDVVYNHTYLGKTSHLNVLAPGYYYRHDAHGNFTNGSGCGNELASERFMVRKMIVDSVVYWASEYKIDGFRFDLMGLMDIITVNEIRSRLNAIDPRIIMFGEGWTGDHSPLPDHLKALKGNMRKLPGTGAFNDDVRDAVKGHVFFGDRPGFINGATGMEESVKCGIVAATKHHQVDYSQVIYTHTAWAGEPAQSINYVEAHDNLTLWDKLLKTNPDADVNTIESMHKLAGAIILTSQGIPFLHAGMEFCRTKAGDANSYKSSDAVNMIDWARKKEFLEVFQYYQGLIKLRNAHPGFRMRTSAQVQASLEFLEMPQGHMVGYVIRDAPDEPWPLIVVIYNADITDQVVKVPSDDWMVVVNGSKAGCDCLQRLQSSQVLIPAISCCVLVASSGFREI